MNVHVALLSCALLCMTLTLAVAQETPVAPQLTAVGQVVVEKDVPYLLDPDCVSHPRLSISFSEQMKQWAEKDALNPPSKGGIVFNGSSTFTRWKTVPTDFAPLPAVNRAYGGSRIWDLWYWADQAVIALEPKIVVVYIGDNDMTTLFNTGGKLVWQPNDNNVAFFMKYVRLYVEKIRAKLPNTRFIFVPVKPCPSRFAGWEVAYKPLNKALAEYCAQQKNMAFVDTTGLMMNPDGTPNANLYEKDMLHFKAEVYPSWAREIRPVLDRMWAEVK